MRWTGQTKGGWGTTTRSCILSRNDDGSPPSDSHHCGRVYKESERRKHLSTDATGKVSNEMLRQMVIWSQKCRRRTRTKSDCILLPREDCRGKWGGKTHCKVHRDKIDAVMPASSVPALYPLGKEAVKTLYTIPNSGLPRLFNPELNKIPYRLLRSSCSKHAKPSLRLGTLRFKQVNNSHKPSGPIPLATERTEMTRGRTQGRRESARRFHDVPSKDTKQPTMHDMVGNGRRRTKRPAATGCKGRGGSLGRGCVVQPRAHVNVPLWAA